MNARIFISMAEAESFVNMALTLCHDKDGIYHPSLKDFATKYSILAYFTDYPISDKDIDDVYRDIYTTDIAAKIRGVACDNEQLSSLISAIDESLEFEKLKEAQSSKLKKLVDGLITAVEQQTENPETTDVVNKVFSEVSEQIASDEA